MTAVGFQPLMAWVKRGSLNQSTWRSASTAGDLSHHWGATASAADRISPGFELANIALALVLEPKGFLEVPIHFRDRQGGHASVKWYGFAQKAFRLIKDLKTLPQ